MNPAVVDDPRTRLLIRWLKGHALEVQRRLKIELSGEADDEGTESEVHSVAERFVQVYGDQDSPPPGSGLEGPSNEGWSEPESGQPGGRAAAPIRLSYRREYEPGEEIHIKISFRKDLAQTHQAGDIQWYLDRSRARNLRHASDGIVLEAAELGHGVIHGDVPGTGLSTSAHYEITASRLFRVTIPFATVSLGSDLVIMTANHDKLEGEVRWELDGPGKIKRQGKRAIYQASQEGAAVLTAFDSARPSVRSTCDITVRGKPRNLICIRGQWFEYEYSTGRGIGAFPTPVYMVAGSDLHRMYLYQQAPGFQEAADNGALQLFLIQAIATSFPSFARFELGDEDLSQVDPRDLPNIMAKLQSQGFEITAELLSGKRQVT